MFGDKVIATISFTQRFFYFSVAPQYCVFEFVVSIFGTRKVRVYSHGRPVEEGLWKANEIYVCLIKPWEKGYISVQDLQTFAYNFEKSREITRDNNVIRVPNQFWNM